jgi:predicted enzyme related to lactoylglutathione lyase
MDGHQEERAVNFNNILIGSEQPDRLVEYYTKLLGEPTMSDGGYTGWAIGQGFIAIGAHDEVKGRNAHPGRLIWNIETSEVKEIFERWKAAGAIVVAEPYSFEGYPDAWIATLADPDDNYFQLMTPMEPQPTG